MLCEFDDLDLTDLSAVELMELGVECVWCGMPTWTVTEGEHGQVNCEWTPFEKKPRGCQDCDEKYALKVKELKNILNQFCVNAYTKSSLLESLSLLEQYGFNCKKPDFSDKRWTQHIEEMKSLSIEIGESIYDMHCKLEWLIDRYIELVHFSFKPKDKFFFEKLWFDCWELRFCKNISKNLISYKIKG